jgi:UrcA family protein
MKNIPLRRTCLLLSGTAAGVLVAGTSLFADDMQTVVVEASAPVHSQSTGQGAPGGASVDLLSVKYHVHIAGLDLTKHADVLALDEQIKSAAKKGCDSIKAQYPTRSMSDDQSCFNDAVKSASAQEKALIAVAEKKATK